MKLLVTGSAGLIGSEVCRFFSGKGASLHGLDNNQRAVFFGAQGDTTWNRDRLLRDIPGYVHPSVDLRDRAGILDLVQSRGPRSVRIAALLKKDLPENKDIPVDFQGFTIGPEFVIGYGLDLDEKYRNLPYIAIWDPTR